MSHKIFRCWFTSLFFALVLSLSGFTPVLAAPPANDDFGSATVVGSLPFSDSVDFTDATFESGEPQCASSSPTVWYSFTPGANAVVRADMQGSSFGDNVFTVYQAIGSGFAGLNALNCANFGGSITFNAQAGTTYYIQAGKFESGAGTLSLNLQEIPPPTNNNFSNTEVIGLPLPFNVSADTSAATIEANEPMPSCGNNSFGKTVWYAFTPTDSGSFSAHIFNFSFTPILAAYTGNSLASLTEVGCRAFGGLLTFHANAGTTYYIQAGGFFGDGSPFQFDFDVTSPLLVGFNFGPSDPSVFDNIQFCDGSFDPGDAGFQSFTWEFGDGATSTDNCAFHQYVADGDYTVVHTVTTFDGRTASTTQIIQVRTHDVTITKVEAPQDAKVGKTRVITVTLRNDGNPDPETVTIDLYRSVAGGGFEWVTSLTLPVPTSRRGRVTKFTFQYTFTSADAQMGKVIFRAVANIDGIRDSFPQDNERLSLMTTLK